MAINNRIGSKVTKSVRREEAVATRVEPFPYIGIVKNNLDPTRSGRLQVWIPDLGGDPDDAKHWRTVTYASPFMGTTSVQEEINKVKNSTNSFLNVPHTYGMWMVPPDVGVEVICIFIAGDPRRGYWIACTNSRLSRHMIPGVAGSTNTALSAASDDIKATVGTGQAAPVVEFNENDPAVFQKPNFANNPKPIHETQYRILRNQGLDRDTIRGVISSSSQRESPSNVFGISTPGRPYAKDPALDQQRFLQKLNDNSLTAQDYTFATRKGGHSFIMDDGSVTGKDNLIRLRTAGGHQVMLNDSDNSMYISHASGTSWIELSNDGMINIYSQSGFNVRSQGSINLHSDNNIRLNAANRVSIFSGTTFQVDASKINFLSTGNFSVGAGKVEFKSGTAFNVQSSTMSLDNQGKVIINGTVLKNTTAGVQVKAPDPIKTYNLPDVPLAADGELYVAIPKALNSIVTIAPTHEPWPRQATQDAPSTTGVQPKAATANSPSAYKNLAGSGVSGTVSDKDIRNQPMAPGTIGPLSKEQTTALLAQIAKAESASAKPADAVCKVPAGLQLQNGKAGYEAINQCGFLGKYQMGYAALQQAGLVKKSCTGTAQLGDPNQWKDGLDRDKFLASPELQEQAIYEFTLANYNTLAANGTITKDTSPEEVGGLLMTAHMLGAGGATNFAKTGQGIDINNGTTGVSYYQKGKYAIANMAPKVAEIQAG